MEKETLDVLFVRRMLHDSITGDSFGSSNLLHNHLGAIYIVQN